MKKILIAFFAFFLILSLYAQKEVEIGVVEKLDNYLPKGIKLVNEKGDTVILSKLIDKPTVISLVYFDCPGICGPLMAGVADVIDKMDLSLGKDYNSLTISFNSIDSPIKAKKKKANYITQLTEEEGAQWQFLTGDQDQIDIITEAFGYKYKKMGMDFAHPGVIMVVSPKGKITRYLYGLQYLPFDLKMAIIEAQDEKSSPTINKILKYCFSYDTVKQTYSLQITRIVATIIIFFALIFLTVLIIRNRRKKIKA